MTGVTVCAACARRTWLLVRLASHLDPARARIGDLLELDDDALVDAVAGRDRGIVRTQLAELDPIATTVGGLGAGVEAVCRCAVEYPEPLRELPSPPAILHVAGGVARLTELLEQPPVAVVGARTPTAAGRELAGGLARDLGAAGLTVVSGMALGIDAAAHEGALAVGGTTVAVLPAGVERSYPPSHRRLRTRILERGAIVSELPGSIAVRRWMFPARNRLIAALGRMTVVVQARSRSGALLTADWARALQRPLGAVPGPAGSPLAAGPHALLRGGARLVEDAGDVLDVLYGAAGPEQPERPEPSRPARRASVPRPEEPLASLLDALADGAPAAAACARLGLGIEDGLAALAALELAGYVARGAGGGYVVRR